MTEREAMERAKALPKRANQLKRFTSMAEYEAHLAGTSLEELQKPWPAQKATGPSTKSTIPESSDT